MMPDHVQVLSGELQRQQGAQPGGGQGGQDGQGMDEALVEHAQDYIDRDQRRQDQDRLAGEGLLEGLAVPWNAPFRVAGASSLSRAFSMAAVAWLSEIPGPR